MMEQNYDQIKPLIYFMKLLAKKTEEDQRIVNKLKLWIPDTIVLGDGDLPCMWFYSKPDGFVYRTDKITSQHVSTKLANYASPDELVAVIKTPIIRNGFPESNLTKLISARELPLASSIAFQSRSGKIFFL